jgi:hypothetical protein
MAFLRTLRFFSVGVSLLLLSSDTVEDESSLDDVAVTEFVDKEIDEV